MTGKLVSLRRSREVFSRMQRAQMGKWGCSSGNKFSVGQYEILSQGTIRRDLVYNSLIAI